MAYTVQMKKEDKEKAVKTKPVQVDLEGKEVEEKPKTKVCPLLAAPCLRDVCEWYLERTNTCAVSIIQKILDRMKLE